MTGSNKGNGGVSRRTFLMSVGGLAASVGILSGGFKSGLEARSREAVFQQEVDKLQGDLVDVAASRDALLKTFAERKIASGGGLLFMVMLDINRQSAVQLPMMFAFDPHFVMLHVQTNRERFLLPTFSLGDLIIEPGTFTLTLFGSLPTVKFSKAEDGRAVATLKGTGSCGVSGSSSASTIGGRELKEEVTFEVTATDGGGKDQGKFSARLLVRESQAPNLYAIFGPEEKITGKLITGLVSVKEIIRLPV